MLLIGFIVIFALNKVKSAMTHKYPNRDCSNYDVIGDKLKENAIVEYYE